MEMTGDILRLVAFIIHTYQLFRFKSVFRVYLNVPAVRTVRLRWTAYVGHALGLER
jgi:hypothetical protein